MTELAIPPTTGVCPRCSSAWSSGDLDPGTFRCRTCDLDQAHVETTPNGSVRRVVGWLLSPGHVLQGRYRVDRILGRGGFGATYLVEDLLLEGKRRALKEIPDTSFDARETEMLSRLHHPAIPDITDRFVSGGLVYLVLEFGGSRTLESVRRDAGGRLPLARVMPWMDQLCDVIGYLHGQRPPIVHRDLKPENILLDESDRVMLIDFGTAKESTSSGATRMVAQSASLGFSPPEQVLGTGTDERSDVYALAATVYVLLTGTLPAAAHERVAGRDLVAASDLLSAIPQSVDRAIRQGLELNIQRRQQSIAEFRRALDPAERIASEHEPHRTVLIASLPGTADLQAGWERSMPDLPADGALANSQPFGAGGAARPEPRIPRPRIVALLAAVLLTGAAVLALGWWRDGRPASVQPQGANGPSTTQELDSQPLSSDRAAAPQPLAGTPDSDRSQPDASRTVSASPRDHAVVTTPNSSALEAFNRLRVPDPEVTEPARAPSDSPPGDRLRFSDRLRSVHTKSSPRVENVRPESSAEPNRPASSAPTTNEVWSFERTGERRID